MDGFEEYEVEKIIKHKRTPQGMKYLIRWKGYSLSDNTWEWEDDLEYLEELLREYKTANKLPQNNTEIHFKLTK
ncbi:Chromodomain Y-like protein 2 [Leucoagaricus sp. SymC.cos]|nr:Chromodomain Y-like protein 2 [Leucoagaricus sp. SymC.cos]